jgi:hypothetical protein
MLPEREGCSHPLRRMIVKVTASRSMTIAKAKSLVSVKLQSQSSIQFLKFFLLNHWATIWYPFYSFMRWVIIVCSLIRVWPSLGEVIVPLHLKVSWEVTFSLWISLPSPVFMPKPSTHRMSAQDHLFHTHGPKVFTLSKMSQIKYIYYINNVSKN